MTMENKKKRINIANIEFTIGNRQKESSGKLMSFKNSAIREELVSKVQPR